MDKLKEQIINIVISKDQFLLPRFSYTIDYINSHPLKPTEATIIYSETKKENCINLEYNLKKDSHIVAQNLYFNKNHTESKLSLASYKYNNATISGIDNNTHKSNLFYDLGKFGFDIFEHIFFFISRYEEVFAKKESNSQSGWLNEKEHTLIRHNLQSYPIIDALISAFFESILNKNISRNTTYSLSHDVDILYRFTPSYKFLRSLMATLYYRRGKDQFISSIKHFVKMKSSSTADPYDNFKELFSHLPSITKRCIYVMSGGNTKFDNNYKISDNKIHEIIELAFEKKYNLGLHPSYNSFSSSTMHSKEKENLEKVANQRILKNRQHCLRWNWEFTPYILENNNFETDSSMGYNRHVGFRCGTGYPYHMYDFINERAFSWKEIPMSFMESSAIHLAKNNNLDLSETMINFFDSNKFNTHIEMNFHNSNFDPLLETGKQVHNFYFNTLNNLIE